MVKRPLRGNRRNGRGSDPHTYGTLITFSTHFKFPCDLCLPITLSFKGYSGYILRDLRYLFRKSLLFFAEALGARTGRGKISDRADSEQGRNRQISGGLPEGSEKLISVDWPGWRWKGMAGRIYWNIVSS